MPKNKGAGGKTRKRGKNESDDQSDRELIFKEDGQDYGQVIKNLGGLKFEVFCFEDEHKRICHVRGKLVKKVWICVGDIVLISLRDFQKNEGDIIHKYNNNEIKNLQNYGEIKSNVILNDINDTKDEKDDYLTINFENEEINFLE